MGTFVDPRGNPAPPWIGPARTPVANPAELALLVHAITAGRLYEAEAWVRDGRPLQFVFPKDCRKQLASPLDAAISAGLIDVVLLLVCNGYRLELERYCPLTSAIQRRRRDIVELLLAWGADPQEIAVEELVDSYDIELMELLWTRGVDLAAGGRLTEALAGATSNKPLYGFVKRHAPEDARIQAALDRALCDAIESEWPPADHSKAVSLCMWAGANPWTPVPDPDDEDRPPESDEEAEERVDYRCAAGRAVTWNRPRLLKLLRLAGNAPRFQRLYALVRDEPVYDVLARISPPADAGALLQRSLACLGSRLEEFSGPSRLLVLRLLADGHRLTHVTDSARDGARDFLRRAGWCGRELVARLQDPAATEEPVLLDIIRSPKVLDQARELGIRRDTIKRLLAAPGTSSSVAAAARRQLRGRPD